MNPTAVAFWICGAATGYSLDNIHGAVIGLAITTGLSILITVTGK